MKTAQATPTRPIWHSAAAFLAAGALLFQTACTTTGTAQRALTEPMSADLEAQVLKETGISGAAIGALVGGLATGGATFLAMTAAGAKAEEALIGAAIGGAAGAIGGGMAGYQQGKKEGQKLVAQAMTRDQVAKYIEGARAYNKRLAQTNATLSAALQRAKSQNDKKTLGLVKKEGAKELKDLDARIANREKAIAQAGWPTKADKAKYQSELNQAKAEKAKLAKIMTEAQEINMVGV
jgi:hypothetical protein